MIPAKEISHVTEDVSDPNFLFIVSMKNGERLSVKAGRAGADATRMALLSALEMCS